MTFSVIAVLAIYFFVSSTLAVDAPTELCWNSTTRSACTVRWEPAEPFIGPNATGTFSLNVDNNTRSLVVRALLRFEQPTLHSFVTVVPEICIVSNATAVDWNACAWSNLGLVLALVGSDTFAQSNVLVSVQTAAPLLIGVRLPTAVHQAVNVSATTLSIVARPTLDATAAFDGAVWSLAFADVIAAQVQHDAAGKRMQFSVQLCSSPNNTQDYVFANLVQFGTQSQLKPGDSFATRGAQLMAHADVHTETSICAAPCGALLNAPVDGPAALLAVALDAVHSSALDPGALSVRLSSAAEGSAPHPFRYFASARSSLQIARSGDDLLVARPLADGVADASLYIACGDNTTLSVLNNANFYSSFCWLQRHLEPVATVPAAQSMFRDVGFFTRCTLGAEVAAVVLAAQNETLANFIYSADDVPTVTIDGESSGGVNWSSPTFGAGIGIGLAIGVVPLVLAFVVMRKKARQAQYNKI